MINVRKKLLVDDLVSMRSLVLVTRLLGSIRPIWFTRLSSFSTGGLALMKDSLIMKKATTVIQLNLDAKLAPG
jgi:hypothetical protein